MNFLQQIVFIYLLASVVHAKRFNTWEIRTTRTRNITLYLETKYDEENGHVLKDENGIVIKRGQYTISGFGIDTGGNPNAVPAVEAGRGIGIMNVFGVPGSRGIIFKNRKFDKDKVESCESELITGEYGNKMSGESDAELILNVREGTLKPPKPKPKAKPSSSIGKDV